MADKIDLTKIDWVLINNEHENGLYWTKIPIKFGIGKKVLNRAEKEGFIKKIKHKNKHTDESRKILSYKMSKYLKENPEKCVWKRSDKLKSVPCEVLKKHFKDNCINFVEEYKPLDNRFFSIDIAFPDKKIGIEVNGTQHYNKYGGLKEYYQKRKEEIEKLGWKLFDVHYSKVYKESFVNELIYTLKKEYDLKNIDYSFYIKKPKKRLVKSRKDYYDALNKINFDKKHSARIKIILESDIDFKIMGWVNKVSKLISIPHTNVNKWMKKFMPEFYKGCFKKRFGLSRIKKYGSKEKYLKHRQKISLDITNKRIELIKKENINLNEKGWHEKLMKLFNSKRSRTYKWFNKNKKHILSEISK